MPILGLTDHAPSFPRIGELRKGAVKSGNRPGADLNGRVRFTSNIEGMVDIFAGEFGNEPNNILCYLPYKTTDENFPAWVEEWGAGSLKWRGDGKNMVLWQKPDGTYSTEKKPQPPNQGNPGGKLHIIIPALKRMGYVIALTTSLNDIMELTGNLRAYETLRGDLRGIPFILSRVPRMISTPSGKDGKRARREKWLLHLETVPDYTAAQLEYTANVALPTITTPTRALSSGHDEFVDFETGEIVGEESFDAYAAEIGEDNIADNAPRPAGRKPPTTQNLKPTAAMTKQFHAVGKKAYGDEWDTKRAELVLSATKTRSSSSRHLTREECQKLIDGMKSKIDNAPGLVDVGLDPNDTDALREVADYI